MWMIVYVSKNLANIFELKTILLHKFEMVMMKAPFIIVLEIKLDATKITTGFFNLLSHISLDYDMTMLKKWSILNHFLHLWKLT
jgi:hypothetical protein